MNRGVQAQPSVEDQFFNPRNEAALCQMVASDLQQRMQVPMNETIQVRLVKSVKHQMQETWDVNGPMPIQSLNRAVATSVSKDFAAYLRRPTQSLAASQAIVADNSNRQQAEQPRISMGQQVTQRAVMDRPTFEPSLLLDTSARFEQLQTDRMPQTQTRPPIPDFTIPLTAEADGLSSLSLFENAKKAREEEANRMKAIGEKNAEQMSAAISDANPLVRFVGSPAIMNDGNNNPTLAQPLIVAPRGPLPQDNIIKQDDILNQKEIEQNLFVQSADRNWLNNTRESRYSFTVNFDPANNTQGFTFSPSTNKKFKNISRIELVKAIMPTEGLTNILQRASSAVDATAKLNILSFPYINVRIAELENNNFGTDDHLNNAFAMLQYDANWYPDTTNLSDGFLGMIPKFLKCQKVQSPTPLATLQKLSIEFQRPNGNLVSDTLDTLNIQSLFFADTMDAAVQSSATTQSTANYIVIQTADWFNQWTFVPGNTIQLKGLVANQINNQSSVSAAANDFVAWLERSEGHIIVAVANSTSAGDGVNSVGYGNLIIIQNRYDDPTTGSTALQPFGGAANNSALAAALYTAGPGGTTVFTGAKLINLTHQTTLVFRIICRELDPAARVRPDNL